MSLAQSCIVFDTSTLIGCCITQHGPPAKALAKALRSRVLVMSSETLAELSVVVRRDKFDAWRPLAHRLAFLNGLVAAVRMVPVSIRVNDCRDAKDNKFLELALTAKAGTLVSSDADLLVLHPFQGIDIQTPAQFLLAGDAPPMSAPP